MRKVETYASQQDCKFTVHRKSEFWQAVSLLGNGRFRVTIEKIYRKRSISQNAYYWGVIIYEFCNGFYETTGEKISPEEAHETLKRECNGKEISNKDTGEVIKIGQTTTIQTTVQAMEYYERCIKFIAEWFHVEVPAPNEQTEMFK